MGKYEAFYEYWSFWIRYELMNYEHKVPNLHARSEKFQTDFENIDVHLDKESDGHQISAKQGLLHV